jgi:hypothetical protein
MNRTTISPEDRAVIEAAADLAIDIAGVVQIDDLGLVVVSDTIMLEGTANGLDCPRTDEVRRYDGRSAYLYSLPDGAKK